ncbi:MAG: penicillin-binding protein 1C [Anaerolineaceae bacterium]|nr:MAG: penicillin-binding protein 1C [Anaerolineaceae bacterium]
MKSKRIVVLLVLLASIFSIWLYFFYDLPSVDSLSSRLIQPSVRITDRNGVLLYELIPSEGGRHAALAFESMPQCIKDATIAVEDRNFYSNPGVDIEGIVRAFWINLQGGETLAGGSTITQQVARNILLTDELGTRSPRRKVREIVLAWQMTRQLSKDEILALYLNQTYYGGMAYGIEAASQTFFSKPASELTLPECALLAGLPQSPGGYNPFTNPEATRERQRVVLGLMEKDGYIISEERALAEETILHYTETPYPIRAPHFVWMVKSQIDALEANGKINLAVQSLVIRTTLDLNIQQIAEEAITRQLREYRERAPEQNVNNAAVVVLEPHTGEILALVGSADYFDESIAGSINMVISPRQPGSAFKPFLYAQALDPRGQNPWTAATPMLDVTTTFPTHEGASYTPKNYDGLEHGLVPVRESLASSLNIPAVLTLEHAGISNTIHFAQQLGITTLGDPNEYDLSLALGGGQMSLHELTSAYAVLADEGIATDHPIILDIRDADGTLLLEPTPASSRQILDPRVVWLLSDILADDEARAIGFGRNSTLKIDRPAAVKTGTTTNFHDNWTIGYTPDIVVGVWVGNSDYKAMKDVTGLTGAAPIWHEVIRKALEGKPKCEFARPDGLVQVKVCALSGLLPTEFCDHTRVEWFIAGTEPTQSDTIYQQVTIDTLTGSLADASTPADRVQTKIVLDLPITAHPWARSQGLPLLADIPQTGETSQPQIALISPRPNSTYRFDPAFDASAQKLLIEAVVGAGVSEVTIWADSVPLATLTESPYQAWWQLSVGEHRFWATGLTANGETVTSEVIVVTVSD